MKQYLDLLDILVNGRDGYRVVERGDRTGTGTRAFFGHQMRFDLTKGFPLLTTKKIRFRAVVAELLWFIRGNTNVEELRDLGAKIWDPWAVRAKDILKANSDNVTEDDIYMVRQRMEADGFFQYEEVDSWEAVEIEYKGYPVTEYRSPHYDQELIKGLIERGRLPEECMAQLGEVGPIYGAQWRNWGAINPEDVSDVGKEGLDQLSIVIDNLKNKPYSRRHVVTAWNPDVLPDESVSPQQNAIEGRQSLPACHALFQFYVEPDRMVSGRKVLSCQVYIRSNDIFVGAPFNIASYALLTHLVANECGYHVGELVYTTGDTHLYNDHFELAQRQLERSPTRTPNLVIYNKDKSMFDMKPEDIEVQGYDPHPPLRANVSV